MIKLEHVVLASPEQMEFIIEGMRNPLNSWEKSDSRFLEDYDFDPSDFEDGFYLGPNDHGLMQRLANAGTDHRKFMRMMPVYVRITAPLYWQFFLPMKHFSRLSAGVTRNKQSPLQKGVVIWNYI